MSDDDEARVVSGDELPRLVDAGALVAGLRDLQQRIPEYTQLSAAEVRSLMRVAYLDPEFVESTLQAAAVWDQTQNVIGRSAAELRDEAEECRRWDEVERELAIVLKGISAANLKRKHRLGKALWQIYNVLSVLTRRGINRNLMPYFEAMKQAYLKKRKKPAKSSAE